MLESAVLTLGLLRFQLTFSKSATLFLSFKVRACCDSAVDFIGKKVVSVVLIFKIEVAHDFFVTEQRISTSWGACRPLVAQGELPPAALRLLIWRLLAHELHRRAESNFRFVPVAQNQSRSFHFTLTFPKNSLSSPIMPCSRSFFNVTNRAFPTSDWSSIDRWIRKC